MEERVSTIKKVELKKGDMHSMIVLNGNLSGTDLKFLEDEFELYKEDIDSVVSKYKDIGIVFNLTQLQEGYLKDWKTFIREVIRHSEEMDRFKNILLNKSGDKVLLITNKRLIKMDFKNLNEKIEDVNYKIEDYNEKIEIDRAESEREMRGNKGLFSRLIEVLRK
ncbi:MAG: hypothetical protein KKC75_02995 [Nanoarchaeota archaeon]|nr:hypothetical protein [Nanoarchaeota archaeon]MBU1004555.1 hypothetical protein [Nanoarchaeota archaeon]MBU1945794.1 hypothetical protein [Nanoarchaeota archaeon]